MYRNIKNRTVCFQERFRLLSLAAVLRKHPSWFQNPIDIVFWNRNACFLRTGRSQNPENKSVLFFIKSRLCSMQYPSCENPWIQVTSGSNQSQQKFHNVNCRFCGAIHSVNWEDISVRSQVIRNVNERKTVQTNMISFVSHGAGILKISWSSASQNFCSEAQRNARRTGTSYFVCTVFLFHYI